ncbi:MAG: hypothetical protein HUU06_01620 [Planctomycetaceae bacterium]|nr:hypothetical protein [Planctomycetota bacterium]NUN51472.1 hypothetical protein [Planctomycetaceae bacterium]
MKRLSLTLAALLAVAPVSLAQEGAPKPEGGAPAPAAPAAPAKHVNVITDAAKAAFEAMEKIMYSPVVQGLKDLTGTIEMKMEMAGMEGQDMGGGMGMGMSFDVTFKAPKDIKVGSKGGEMFGPQADGMKEGVKQIILNSLGIWVPVGDEEYDADLVTEEGKKVLVVTSYKDNKKQGVFRLTLADNYLPVAATATNEVEMMPGTKPVEQTVKMKWQFAKDGDLHRLEKWTVEVPMMPTPIEYVLEYADAGGFKLPVKFVMDLSAMGMTSGYRFTSLTVNGKAVELPGAKKAEPAGTPTEKGGEGGMEHEGGGK